MIALNDHSTSHDFVSESSNQKNLTIPGIDKFNLAILKNRKKKRDGPLTAPSLSSSQATKCQEILSSIAIDLRKEINDIEGKIRKGEKLLAHVLRERALLLEQLKE